MIKDDCLSLTWCLNSVRTSQNTPSYKISTQSWHLSLLASSAKCVFSVSISLQKTSPVFNTFKHADRIFFLLLMKWWLKFLLPDSRPTLTLATWNETALSEDTHAGCTSCRDTYGANHSIWRFNFFYKLHTNWCETFSAPKQIFPRQRCVCFCNGFQSVITGSPRPWVTWFVSVNITGVPPWDRSAC